MNFGVSLGSEIGQNQSMLWNARYVCRQGKNRFDTGVAHNFVPPPQISRNYLSDWQNYGNLVLNSHISPKLPLSFWPKSLHRRICPILGGPKNDRQGKNHQCHDILVHIPDTYLIEVFLIIHKPSPLQTWLCWHYVDILCPHIETNFQKCRVWSFFFLTWFSKLGFLVCKSS